MGEVGHEFSQRIHPGSPCTSPEGQLPEFMFPE